MIVRVLCPNPDCRQRYKVDDTRLGRTTVCKHCGRKFTLSTTPQGETPLSGDRAETIDAGDRNAADLPAADMPNREMPKQLGRFELRGRLGRGAFGEVYRAYDPVLQREVALKVPRAMALLKPQARARFLREPKAAAQLRHPHIVPVFDAGSDGDHFYIASAYIEGRTLEAVIDNDQPDFRRAAEIVRDLAEALDYAHGIGVVHRDVKPANVMVDERGEAMLMDFGLARLDQSEEKLTQDGTVMGTPAYMAPEQADGSFGEVGPAADQYSLGVVLYEMLCGEPPFSGPPTVLLFNTLHQEPEPPRNRNSEVPPDIETICLKAISKRPAERYAGCEALSRDLQRWLDDEPILARTLGTRERLERWCRRNPIVAALVAAVVMVTLVGLTAATGLWLRAEGHRSVAETSLAEAQRQRVRAEDNLAEANRQREAAEKNLAEAQRQRTRAEDSEKGLAAALKQAQANLAEAQRQQKAAEAAQAAERREFARAEDAQQKADAHLSEAERQRLRAESRERIARRQLYVTHMNQAMQALEAKNIARVRELLDRHRPVPGKEDLRAFEWYYLSHECGVSVAEGEFALGAMRRRPILTLSPDKKTIALSPSSRYADSGFRLWDIATAEVRLNATCCGFAFSPDGGRVALASHFASARTPSRSKVLAASGSITIFNTRTGEKQSQSQLSSPDAGIYHIEFSNDGQTLVGITYASEKDDLSIRFWDVTTGKERASASCGAGSRINSRNTPPYALGGSTFAVTFLGAGSASYFRAWDTTTGKENSPSLLEFVNPVAAIAVSPSGQMVAAAGSAVGSAPTTLAIWNLDSGEQRTLLKQFQSTIDRIEFSPDGTRLAAIVYWGTQRAIRIWDVASGSPVRSIETKGTPYDKMCFSPGGNLLAAAPREAGRFSGPARNRFSVWDVDTGRKMDLSSAASANFIGFLSDNSVLAAQYSSNASNYKEFRLREIDFDKNKKPTHLSVLAHGVTSIAVSPDGRLFAAGSQDGTISVDRVPAGGDPIIYQEHLAPVGGLCFSPDGERIASAGHDKTAVLWNIAKKQREPATLRHEHAMLTIAYSPDGKFMVTGCADGSIAMRMKGAIQPLKTYPLGHGTVHCVAVSPDGKTIAAGCDDHGVVLLTIGQTERKTLEGHTGAVLSVAFSPDGGTVASAGKDGTIRLWDVAEAKEIDTLGAHASFVNAVVYSPDGQTIISAGEDRTIRIWDVPLRLERAVLRGHTDPVRSLALSLDGMVLISGSSKGAIRTWRGR